MNSMCYLIELNRNSNEFDRFRFLERLYNFFKPDQNGSFNEILLTDSLSDVTCRTLLAFSDLLVYPSQTAANHIKVINHRRNSPSEKYLSFEIFQVVASNIVRKLLLSVSDSFYQV